MNITPSYKGYIGKMIVDADLDVIQGEIVGIRDVVTFEGRSVEETVQAFRDSVDDYLDFCREEGKEPEKPLAGELLVRADPELHRRIALAAEAAGMSINAWIVRHLAEDTQRELSGAA